ncbi:hypothetical protein BDN70DRAFT_897361 [Pholiota conissans]|uniref:Uncharacterized protein n=1 Tax=Pholiota conissans TaxID=109636 RepID=A0A9P6CY95_9AGAR|nr:hypothetical protein BDN70DRAFT_897361 [Pholiota conissans]
MSNVHDLMFQLTENELYTVITLLLLSGRCGAKSGARDERENKNNEHESWVGAESNQFNSDEGDATGLVGAARFALPTPGTSESGTDIEDARTQKDIYAQGEDYEMNDTENEEDEGGCEEECDVSCDNNYGHKGDEKIWTKFLYLSETPQSMSVQTSFYSHTPAQLRRARHMDFNLEWLNAPLSVESSWSRMP